MTRRIQRERQSPVVNFIKFFEVKSALPALAVFRLIILTPSMAFKNACEALRDNLPHEDMNREIVSYLLDNAVGRKNICSWPTIEAHLRTKGFKPSKNAKEHFQVSFLGATRDSDSFIGSTNQGYFIINSIQDAYACLSFYIKKISSMQERAENLRKLMDTEYLSED